jgi:hypothetical protein
MDPELINPELNDDELLQKLNGETAKLSWKELEPHFARGVVVRIDPKLDLLQIALSFSRDDRSRVEMLMSSGSVALVSDDDAIGWTQAQPEFWAIVVAPWILIQQIG